MEKIPVLVIAGPTASGKTALAVELAKKYNGEVVSADSMQIYKRMDIGTAKPDKAEMAGVVHHMIDIAEPEDSFSVADYVDMAHKVIADIVSRKKLPIVAGGTGLYINSLIDDADFSKAPSNDTIKDELYEIFEKEGAEPLLEMLKKVDPVSFERIHPNNIKRVIRAIEFYRANKRPLSEQSDENQKKDSRYNPLMLMINPKREVLYERIEKRVDIMLERGLIDEVKRLSAEGLTKKNQSMQGIGYKEVLEYLNGFMTMSEMIRILKRNSRRYAKRQFTWFKRDPRMINIENDLLFEAAGEIDKWLKNIPNENNM